MVSFSSIGLAMIGIIAVSFCGASPTPTARTALVNTTKDNDTFKIPHWLESAVESVKNSVGNKNLQEDSNSGLQYANVQQKTLKLEDSGKKEDEEPGTIPSIHLNTDTVNPFVRSKRSTCAAPANLPQLVKDLNTRLTVSQFVGLNPVDSTTEAAPSSQFNTCPSATGDWWPRNEVNLRSTCPWKLQQVDLGVNAFPRYVNTAVCLCGESCIGAPSMRCMAVTHNVTYFNRTGCQNGLAVMEKSQYTVNIGCTCVSALIQATLPNYNGE